PALARAPQLLRAQSEARCEGPRRLLLAPAVKRQHDPSALGRRLAEQIEKRAVARALDQPPRQMDHQPRPGKGQSLAVALEIDLADRLQKTARRFAERFV